MRILITGGAGFIGSNFISYMLSNYPDYELICIDNLTYAGNLKNLEFAIESQKFQFIKGDICDSKFVSDVHEKHHFDAVINFAAESHVDRSISDPDAFLRTNILGTQVLLEASKRFQVNRFHQVSTDEVYGDLPIERTDLLFKENSSLVPSSPYAASKASADLLVLAYKKTYALPITISRCSNNFGPYQFPEKLIPLVILQALKNQDIPVYGTGQNVRDWLHVQDHSKAIDLIIHKGAAGQIYNVGGNNEKTNLDVVKMILNRLSKPESLIKYVADRPGHDRRYAIDSTKIRKELGWKPTTGFDQGIEDTIEWYLENREWWTDIINGDYQEYYKEMYSNR